MLASSFVVCSFVARGRRANLVDKAAGIWDKRLDKIQQPSGNSIPARAAGTGLAAIVVPAACLAAPGKWSSLET
jgi:hypothetical protein